MGNVMASGPSPPPPPPPQPSTPLVPPTDVPTLENPGTVEDLHKKTKGLGLFSIDSDSKSFNI